MSTQEQILIERVRKAASNIFERELSESEKQYMLSRYPYIVISNYESHSHVPDTLLTRTQAKNGWPILDYGDHLIAGCSELMAYLLQQQGLDEAEDEGGKGGKPHGYGTIVQQFTDVAFELIQLAIKKGWSGVKILDGYYSMSRMAWIACEMEQFHCSFKPTIEDVVVRNWAMHIRAESFYPHAVFPKKK